MTRPIQFHFAGWAAVLALSACSLITVATVCAAENSVSTATEAPAAMEHSASYQWMDILLEASAQDVERVGARPTILSRQMAIPVTAAFDAWAAYDAQAVGTQLGGKLRRPASERSQKNKETAIAFAMYRTLIDQLPFQREYIDREMRRMGFDPSDESLDITTPVGIGNRCAKEVLDDRHHDGANQLGDEMGSNGQAYADYTMYRPVNPVDHVIDPDRWQPLPFSDGKGGTFYPGFLTAHWYRVRPFALNSSDQFRAEPPPLVGSPDMQQQVDECIEFNCSLTIEQKAIVEFMRDGPRSTGQSGHWLRFAQAVSRRDKNDLDRDVKLFFTIGNTAMDAFIAAWDSKRYYDTSRPWTLIRHYYADQTIRGWAGPGLGVVSIQGSQWLPYSPATFVTPPFPGYVSGHSTVSAACATALKLFEGADEFTYVEHRRAGELTENDFKCEDMQKVDGKHLTASGRPMSCEVDLPIKSFTEAAEMAGISRVMGGYHIQADNIAGLKMGREVAEYSWPKYQSYFDGTAK